MSIRTEKIDRSERKTFGFALIDALIGLSVASVLCTVFVSGVYQASVNTNIARDKLTASLSTLEIYEVAVSMAEDDYDDLVSDLSILSCDTSPCHFENNGSSWSTHPNEETVDGRFQRSFRIYEVYRDSVSGDIIETGGILDTETIGLDIEVNWTNHGEAYTEQVSTYLHKLNNP